MPELKIQNSITSRQVRSVRMFKVDFRSLAQMLTTQEGGPEFSTKRYSYNADELYTSELEDYVEKVSFYQMNEYKKSVSVSFDKYNATVLFFENDMRTLALVEAIVEFLRQRVVWHQRSVVWRWLPMIGVGLASALVGTRVIRWFPEGLWGLVYALAVQLGVGVLLSVLITRFHLTRCVLYLHSDPKDVTWANRNKEWVAAIVSVIVTALVGEITGWLHGK